LLMLCEKEVHSFFVRSAIKRKEKEGGRGNIVTSSLLGVPFAGGKGKSTSRGKKERKGVVTCVFDL